MTSHVPSRFDLEAPREVAGETVFARGEAYHAGDAPEQAAYVAALKTRFARKRDFPTLLK